MGARFCHGASEDPAGEIEEDAETCEEPIVCVSLAPGASYELVCGEASRTLMCGIGWEPPGAQLRVVCVLLDAVGQVVADLGTQPHALQRNGVAVVRVPPGGRDTARVRFAPQRVEAHIYSVGFGVSPTDTGAKDPAVTELGPAVRCEETTRLYARLLDTAVSDDDALCEVATDSVPAPDEVLLLAALSRCDKGWKFQAELRCVKGCSPRPKQSKQDVSPAQPPSKPTGGRQRVSITLGGVAAQRMPASIPTPQSEAPKSTQSGASADSGLQISAAKRPKRPQSAKRKAKPSDPQGPSTSQTSADAVLIQHEWGDGNMHALQAAVAQAEASQSRNAVSADVVHGAADADSDAGVSWASSGSDTGKSKARK